MSCNNKYSTLEEAINAMIEDKMGCHQYPEYRRTR